MQITDIASNFKNIILSDWWDNFIKNIQHDNTIIFIILLYLAIIIAIIIAIIKARKSKIPTSNSNNKKKHPARTFLIVVSVCAVLGVGGYFLIDKITRDNGVQNPIVAITKKAPTLTAEQTLTSININILANADYEEVIVKLEIIDDSKIIIGNYTLTGTNYKKGYTYQLTHSLSLNEMLNGSQYRCKVTSYR